MKSLWRCPAHLANRRETASTLAACRILFCTVALLSLLDARDVSQVIWLRPEDGGMFRLTSKHWVFAFSGGVTPDAVSAVKFLSMLFLSLGGLGLGGRLPLLLAAQFYGALTGLNANASGSYDSLIVLGLSVLFLSGSHQTLSLDCYLKTRQWTSRRLVYSLPHYLLVAQVLVMYTFTGFQKIGLSWTPFGGYDALYYILQDPTFTRFGAWTTRAWPALQVPLLKCATALSWHWEQSAPLLAILMVLRRTGIRSGAWQWLNRIDWRVPWLGFGVLMHAGILLLLEVGPFSYISVSFYVAFFRPSDWRRFRQGWIRRFRVPLFGSR